MSGFIKAIIYGHLTRNPEQRVTTEGLVITKFSIAVSRSYKGQDGNQKEEVTFLDVDAFGKSAELIAQYFTKGKPILFEGRIRQDSWETPTGERRSKHVVVLESFHFISSGRIEREPSSSYEMGFPPATLVAVPEMSFPAVTPVEAPVAPPKIAYSPPSTPQKPTKPVVIQELNEEDVPF